MPFYQALKPLFLASVAAVVVLIALSGDRQLVPPTSWGAVVLAAWMWALTLAAGVVFVLPVLALAPQSRRPPIWVAAGWGALTACASAVLILGRPYKLYSPRAMIAFAAAGAVAGVCYAMLARRQPGATG